MKMYLVISTAFDGNDNFLFTERPKEFFSYKDALNEYNGMKNFARDAAQTLYEDGNFLPVEEHETIRDDERFYSVKRSNKESTTYIAKIHLFEL